MNQSVLCAGRGCICAATRRTFVNITSSNVRIADVGTFEKGFYGKIGEIYDCATCFWFSTLLVLTCGICWTSRFHSWLVDPAESCCKVLNNDILFIRIVVTHKKYYNVSFIGCVRVCKVNFIVGTLLSTFNIDHMLNIMEMW